MLAVNSYNESGEKIRAFVEKKSLTHPILLQGRAVSKSYFVRAHPTHFLIDRNGIIVERFVGFIPGSQKQWEEKLRKIIERKEK